ncbi:MAG: hydroxymethylbilane synthase [Bacteroidia bacterium]|nr:hydroxymethylbilane synthase [Bacteroidia bacterium]
MRNPLIIGTRGSELALWQANFVKSSLEEAGIPCELKIIRTKGDNIQHLSFEKMEGKGFFTREIEEALLSYETDIAVHSHKDLPTEPAPGLIIAAVSERENPAEIFLIRKSCVDTSRKFCLKHGAIVGTSSARRKSQLLAFRKDVQLKDLRGNIPTRIGKLREGLFDAILIASAGVARLETDLSDFRIEQPDPREFIPAPAQGVLAIQVRMEDRELIEKIQVLHHPEVLRTISIERKILNLFQGGCQMPVGAYAEFDEETGMYSVRACKSRTWDELPVCIYADSKDPEVLAERVVIKIRSVRPSGVFITRDIRPDDYFAQTLTAHQFNVTGQSLIETRGIAFREIPDCDWIFFSSRQAVQFFFQQHPVLKSPRFACVGKSTAETLRKFGHRAEFIGSSVDTRMTGKQFAALAGNSRVLFPQAKGSLRSVQQQFSKKEKITDLVVYETLRRPLTRRPDSGILVFTSPSNVESWLNQFEIPPTAKIIAMGDATANALKQKGYTSIRTDAFDDTGLARAVFGVSSKS